MDRVAGKDPAPWHTASLFVFSQNETHAAVFLPALKNGFITFGCFNNTAKLNDKVIKYWSKLLNSVPNSRLILKSQKLESIYGT